MYPRSTKHLIPEVAQETGHSEDDCSKVINFFFKEFIPNRIRGIEDVAFRIKGLGEYRASTYESLTRLKAINTMIEKIEDNTTSISEDKIQSYYEDREKIILNLSKLTKVYGREYMEKKFGEKFTEQQIPDFGGTKEQLVQTRTRRRGI